MSGDERADADQDGRTRLARPNSQAELGQKNIIFHVQLTAIKIGNHTRLILSLLYVMTISYYTYFEYSGGYPNRNSMETFR